MVIAAPDSNKYLTFTLGADLLALSIARIREILSFTEPTQVLRMPPYVRGVINLRGSVVPVLDLALRFGRGVEAAGKKACILIIEVDFNEERHVLGVIVDAVNEVLVISAADIEPPPTFGGSIRSEFLQGLAKIRGRFVALLDAARVFNMGDLAQPESKVPQTRAAR
jgi:purine-binding chemotaxis protein CheW